MKIYVSGAMYPNFRHEDSVRAIVRENELGLLYEEGLGFLNTEKFQLVPQNIGQITPSLASELYERYDKKISFRLHANVRVLDKHEFVDLNDYIQRPDYFTALSKVNQAMGSPDYSLHSGKRTIGLMSLFDNCKRLQDQMQCRVAIEGQYRTPRANNLLVSTLREYEALLNSGCYMAIDLSHLNIVAAQQGVQMELVKELLRSPNTIEVHLSDNDGSGDSHQQVAKQSWWSELLTCIDTSNCTVFSEGNRRTKTPSIKSSVTTPTNKGESVEIREMLAV